MKRLLVAAGVAVSLFSCSLLESVADDLGLTDGEIIDGLKLALRSGADSAATFASNSYWSDSTTSDKTTTAQRGVGDDAWTWARDYALRIALPDTVDAMLGKVETLTAWTKTEVVPGYSVMKLMESGVVSKSISDNMGTLTTARDTLWQAVNRAAEDAAPSSKNIFVDAITAMNIDDARNILFPKNSSRSGDVDSVAATTYLHTHTHDTLKSLYTNIIDTSLHRVKAVEKWNDLSGLYGGYQTNYNTIYDEIQNFSLFDPKIAKIFLRSGMTRSESRDLLDSFKKSIPAKLPGFPNSTELIGHTTGKALTGLFNLVGGEEVKIRRDPLGYAKGLIPDGFLDNPQDLLEKVFTAKE